MGVFSAGLGAGSEFGGLGITAPGFRVYGFRIYGFRVYGFRVGI